MKGWPVTRAAAAMIPMETSPFTKANTLITTVESCRSTREASRARAARPPTTAAISPPIGPW